MERKGIDFPSFLRTPAGRLLLDWESRAVSRVVEESFGCAALQVGFPEADFLVRNLISLHVRTLTDVERERGGGSVPAESSVVLARPEELPFESESIDLVVMPHVLDTAGNEAVAQQALREAARILLPEGRLVLTAFNPAGLWWMRERFSRAGVGRGFLPGGVEPVALARLRDWFAVLGLEIDRGRFGGYAPPLRGCSAMGRFSWMEKAGDRWWPVCGSLVMLSARKHNLRAYMAGAECFSRPAVATGARTVAGTASARGAKE